MEIMKDLSHPGALYVKGEALYHLGKIWVTLVPCMLKEKPSII